MGRLTAAAATIAAGATAALTTACATGYPQPEDARFAALAELLLPPPGPAVDSGAFIIVEDDEPFATEHFRRRGDRLETDLVVYNQVRVRTTARLRPDASVRRIEFRLFPPDTAATPLGARPAPPAGAAFQTSAADFSGDSLRLEEPIGTAVQTTGYPHRVVPEIDLSAAYLEQLLRRARALEADPPADPDTTDYGGAVPPVPVPFWRPGSGDAIDTALIALEPDRATLLIRDTAIRARTDAQGRLLAAAIPQLALYIHRR